MWQVQIEDRVLFNILVTDAATSTVCWCHIFIPELTISSRSDSYMVFWQLFQV